MNETTFQEPALAIARQLQSGLLTTLKREYVGKDEVIDLLGICLAAGENLFLLGPPGTAKSAIVRSLAARLEGRVFDYLLTAGTAELIAEFNESLDGDPVRDLFPSQTPNEFHRLRESGLLEKLQVPIR